MSACAHAGAGGPCPFCLEAALAASQAREKRLREALRGLVAQLMRGEDSTPGDFDRAWRAARAALAEEVEP